MRRRAARGGFTLLELLVVVTLIALIAMIAVPSFSTARNDKLTFSFAREVTQIFTKARSNAAGSGAAQLVVFTKQFNNNEGAVITFESRDNACAPGALICPSNPSPTCNNAVTFASAWNIGTPNNPATGRVVPEALLNIGTTSAADLKRAAGIVMEGFVNTTGVPVAANGIAVCVTPLGETYVGVGTDIATSVGALQAFGLPFGDLPPANDPTVSGVASVEIVVRRATGIRRRVIVAGGSAGRIRSE